MINKIISTIKYMWILLAVLTSCFSIYVSVLLLINSKDAVDCWLAALVCLGILNPLIPPTIIYLLSFTASFTSHLMSVLLIQLIIQVMIIFSYIQWFVMIPYAYKKLTNQISK